MTVQGEAWKAMDAHEANQALYASKAVPGVVWSCERTGLGGLDNLRAEFPDGLRYATVIHELWAPARVGHVALGLADAWALGELR